MLTRVCNDCGTEKELDQLVVNHKCLYGHRKLCKACNVQRVLARTNPEQKAKYDLARRKVKSEGLRAYDRLRAANPNRRAAKNEHTRKRRANLLGATPENYDREGVLSMYRLAQKISKITGVLMHVDHIVPLSKGGKHDVDNLQLLAAKLNIAKGSNPHWQLPWNAYPK